MEETRRVDKSHRKHQSTKPHHDAHKQHKSRGPEGRTHHQREEVKEIKKLHVRDLLSTAPALSGDDDYVRRWLANAEKETREDHADRNRASGSRRKSESQVHNNNPLDQKIYLAKPEPKRKRKYKSSSDSSLINPPPKRAREFTYEEPSSPAQQPKQRQKIKKINLPEPEPQSSVVNEVFHKRARHKTREDRYESKTTGIPHHKEDAQEGERPKKPTKSRQKKAARKTTGAELMQNFKSDKISNDRLTMRPSNGPGLFKNGRASSPVRRRGVPDLAFSEMGFLQHASRYQATSAEVGRMLNSREKEKRKASKVQNNFTTFFQTNRVPLEELERNRFHSSSAHAIEPDMYQKQREKRGEAVDRMNASWSQPRDYSEHSSYLGFGQPACPSYQKTPRTVPTNVRAQQLSTSLLSERATSYVSWSETQPSPHKVAERNRLANVEEARETHSPTPESIRRIIEETKIFRNTCIETPPRHKKSSHKERPREQKGIPTQLGRPEFPTSSNSHTGLGQHAIVESEFITGPANQQLRFDVPMSVPTANQVHRPVQLTQERPEQAKEPSREGPSRNHIVEHSDKKQGWHQQPSPLKRISQTPGSATRSEPQKATSIPLSRDQIAKQVRIKRPLNSMSRLSNPSILDPIPETEMEAEHEQQHPASSVQNTFQIIEPHRSESVLHTNHGIQSEHKFISAARNRAVSSMGSIPTPDFRTSSGFGVNHASSAQTTPFTQATSHFQHPQLARELNSNIVTPQVSHYLGLPVRGGLVVNSNVPLSAAVHPIYTSQILQPNMYERAEDYNGLAYRGTFEQPSDYQENEFPSCSEDVQYEDDGQYQDLADTRGNHFVAGRNVYQAPRPAAQNSDELNIWQPNADDYTHNTPRESNDQNNDNYGVNDNYADFGMDEFGEEAYPVVSMLEQQEDPMRDFWRPQWNY